MGSIYLDLYCQDGSLPIGYNNDYLIDAVSSPKFDPYILQNVATALYPPLEFYNMIKRVLIPIAPEGLSEVLLTGSGSSNAVEQAIRAAFLKYHEFNPTVKTEDMQILAFENASHGHSLSTIGLSKKNPLSSKLPTLNVVSLPLPGAKLPINTHGAENYAAEKSTLERIIELIKEGKSTDKPIAAIIVEPIQNKYTVSASHDFYRKLHALAKESGIPFIVDEVHTGCGATGKLWASQYWMEKDNADILVFGKKMQVSGYFCKPEFRPKDARQITDTWNNVGLHLARLEVSIEEMMTFEM